MKTNQKKSIPECRRPRWPFQRRSTAWLPTLTLCLFGFLLSARAQDPKLTNINNPMDTNVSVGATVSFMVNASTTNPPITRQWQHEGTNLPNATNVSLVITNVTVAHAGGYVAWITNASSAFTNTRTAILTVDPTFTKIMTGVIVTDSEGSVSGNWADYDNDGYADLFVANVLNSGSTRNTLYHNNRGTNFSRVTASPVATDLMGVWAAAWADYNNDGNVDLIAANIDGGILAQRLYRNNGDGSFTAVVDAGLRSDSTEAACPWWIDHDNDGFLDLFMTKGTYFSAVANDCLFRNNGDGTFKKMTAAEVGPILNDQLRSQGCFSSDYDNDGHQELTVVHTFPPVGGVFDFTNITWRCQADGTFVTTTPIGLPDRTTWRWWGDFDNDGWLDALTADSDGPPTLLRNLGAGGFTNVTAALNMITAGVAGWSAWGDYDNDGWLDLFYSGWNTPLNGLFHNNRDGTFTQILNGSPVNDGGNRVAPSWTDYDNDGFLDLFIAVGNAEPARNLLYRNNGNTNHWLKVKLDGRASNRSGIHARVRAQATINGQTISQIREIGCENANAGQNGLLAHFGLGDATNVTTLRIEWPSGIVQEIQNVTNNQFLTVVESQGYTNELRPSFTGATKDASGSQLSFTEPATGARYILEASTNMVTWTKLLARTSTGVSTNYTDARATNYTQRYYRSGAVAAQGGIFLPDGRTAGFGGELRVAAKTRQKGKTMKTKLNLLATGIFLAALGTGFGQSTLQFSASTYTVAESAGAVALLVQRVNNTDTVVSVDYATADGTATSGLKYTATNGTLTFLAGETNQSIVVPILNNGLVDGAKNFRVILSNPINAVLGTRTNVTVSITDNDVGISFQFVTYSVAEEAGAVLIGVVRGDDGMLPVTVDLATTDLTATNGLDYTGMTNTLTFAPTERLKFVPVPIRNDGLKEANETFRVTLSHPTNATLGGTPTTTVTIVDNDQGIQFESATYSVAEDAGAVLIPVTRGDDTNSAATVDYATSDVTAVSGSDYTGSTNNLPFAPGEKVKLVSVPILNDGVKEGSKTFRVTLSNPSGGILGPRTTTTISILDNDPGLGFELSNYSVCEKAKDGEIALTVVRGNDGALGPITVDYATSNLTATAGHDYQAVSNTLVFGENETVKSLTVPILRPLPTGGTKSFRVTLSNPTGGAVLGTAITTVNILENYPTLTPPADARLAIRREGDVNLLTWTGAGQLQRADRVTGPWQTLTTARSPWPVQSPVPMTFYQVKGSRPVNLYVPSSYDGQTPMPLMILLHMLYHTGAAAEEHMVLRPLAEARGFLYCYPDAKIEIHGGRLWNATDAVADFGNAGVDDAGYLRGVIEEIARRFAVDQKRIYLVGDIIGGFMAYRMACQSADLVAGIATLNAGTFLEPSRCVPSKPVNILHIHGTSEVIIFYEGGSLSTTSPYWTAYANMPAFPGAEKSIQIWASYNGASHPVADPAPSLDLTSDIPGLDTVITRYTTCPPGGAVELWTIKGGSHVPTLSSQFSPRVIDWLLAHPKP